jgi:maltose O-acetyltransferase
MLRHVGEEVVVRPTFYCDYGAISIGNQTFINVEAVMLDVASIDIGRHARLRRAISCSPRRIPSIPTRRLGREYGQPITIADNVWLGGGVIVCPGVTIGQDTVAGAGAVVTGDLPAGVIAAGVPARVLREIRDADRVVIRNAKDVARPDCCPTQSAEVRIDPAPRPRRCELSATREIRQRCSWRRC